MLTIDGGVMVAVSCCTTFSFLTTDIALLSICGPFSYMWVARLWAFLKPLMNILMMAASFRKLHLLAYVLNQWTYDEVMPTVTSVHVNPLDFVLASLPLLSLVRSAAVLMSVSQSSNLIESCSLKTGISCSKKCVRLDCFCVVHKVCVYCCITSVRGSADAGGCV